MTFEEACAILGPELCAQLDSEIEHAPPLTLEQVRVVKSLLFDVPDLLRRDVA